MLLVVGRIGRAHGLRGEVTIEIRTDQPELRFADGSVLATDPESVGPLKVRHAKDHSGRMLITFEGIDDRNSAEQLRNTLLLAEVDPDEASDDDEYYDFQLIGSSVELLDGSNIGEVAEVIHLPSQDMLAITHQGRELLVPFIHQFVPEVDIKAKRIVISPPPGLIDETEAVVD
ncbi:ribosome maturation factor RimM [mine drainage metagenome]|uniref:Ribosome maturation factor RimM n=1 Tax=mine drainage metagenome TaxID=410659 RepID=A0A1J5Q469_9ZZZZ